MSVAVLPERRTSADIVFENLYEQIISLKLMPGSRISEAEIAEQFGISRQPVRDAFNRLGNLGLLVIQPQRATQVQRFSLDTIQSARFVRLAIELEIVREASRCWREDYRKSFELNLSRQTEAARTGDSDAFRTLDEEFHRLIADAARKQEAFEIILEKKAQVDRICLMSLKAADEMDLLVADHRTILEAIAAADDTKAQSLLRTHLSRIEKTINAVHEAHGDYFDD